MCTVHVYMHKMAEKVKKKMENKGDNNFIGLSFAK